MSKLLDFLDEVDKREACRVIPVVVDRGKRLKERKELLERSLNEAEQNVKWLNEVKTEFEEITQTSTRKVAEIQSQIDSALHEKERLNSTLTGVIEQLSVLQSHQFPVCVDIVESALKQLKTRIQSETAEKLKKKEEEIVRKAKEELAPHLRQLQLKHETQISLIKSDNSKEINAIRDEAQLKLRTELRQLREQYQVQNDNEMKEMKTKYMAALEKQETKHQREVHRMDAIFDDARKNAERDIASLRSQIEADLDAIRRRYGREISVIQATVGHERHNLISPDLITQPIDNRLIETEAELKAEELIKVRLELEKSRIAKSFEFEKSELLEKEKRDKQNLEIECEICLKKLKQDVSLNDLSIRKAKKRLNRQEEVTQRQKKVVQSAKEMLMSIKMRISNLQNAKVDMKMQPPVTEEEIVSDLAHLRRKIKKWDRKLRDDTESHEQFMKATQSAHELQLKTTFAKVRGAVQKKDHEIADLQNALAKISQQIENINQLR